MGKVLIGILSGVGGLIIGGFGGRKTSNITMKDVIAAPGKAGSAILGAVKKTGQKIGSGLSSLAFWKKKEVKKGKVNLEKDHMDLVEKHQNLSERHTKLSGDFSETVKRMDLVEIDLADKEKQLEQAKEMSKTFQNTLDDQDTDLKQAAKDLKQAVTDKEQAVTDKQKLSSDLKIAQNTITELKKPISEN
jgi:hypothetical protein